MFILWNLRSAHPYFLVTEIKNDPSSPQVCRSITYILSSPFMGIGFEQKCLIVAPHYHILVHCSVTEWYHSLSHMLQPWPSLACTVYRASSMCVWMCESLSRTLVAVDGFIWAPLCVQKLHRVRNSDRSLLSPSLYSPSRHQSPSPLCPSCHYSSLCKRRCSKLTICTTAESFFSSFVLYMDTFFLNFNCWPHPTPVL